MSFSHLARLLAVAPLAVISVACGGRDADGRMPTYATGESAEAGIVAPSTIFLSVGQSQRILVSASRSFSRLVWTSSAPAIASVGNEGLVTAHQPGTAVVVGESRLQRVTTTVVVSPSSGAAQTVSVAFDTTAFMVGSSRQLTARLLGSTGQEVSGASFTYTSFDPAVATVSASGLVSAIATGRATIRATAVVAPSAGSEAPSSAPFRDITIPVTRPTVQSVTVVLALTALTAGQTTQAVATAHSASGTALTGQAVDWTIGSGASSASVNSSGQVTAIAPGTAVIRACVSAVCGTATLTVQAAPTASPLTFPLTAARFQSGSAPTVISAGIPLAPGALTPTRLRHVRLFRGNVEQSIYVEELGRRHPGDFVRSILVQVDAGPMTYGQADTSWRLVLDQGERQTVSRAKIAIDFSDVPAGMLFYTSPRHRVESNILLGPTRTIDESPRREPYLKYHSTAALSGNNYAGIKGALDALWLSHAANLNGAFFNGDAAWPNLHYWVRGGDIIYLERFLRYARAYVANNDRTGGMEWRKWYRTPRSFYWLTGDQRAIEYTNAAADAMWRYHNGDGMFRPTVGYMLDQRAYAQNAGFQLSAWLMGQPDVYLDRSRVIYDTFIRLGMSGPTLGVHYYPDGAGPGCLGQKAYMTGLMHSFMIEHVENAQPSLRPAFLSWLSVGLEQLWRSQDATRSNVIQSPGTPGFAYFWSPEMDAAWRSGSTVCSAVYATNSGGNPGQARPREGYQVEVYAYHARHTGDATSRSRAEEIFGRHNARMTAWASFEGLQGMYNTWSIFGYLF